MVPVAVVRMEAELKAEMTVHPLTFSQISWIEQVFTTVETRTSSSQGVPLGGDFYLP